MLKRILPDRPGQRAALILLTLALLGLAAWNGFAYYSEEVWGGSASGSAAAEPEAVTVFDYSAKLAPEGFVGVNGYTGYTPAQVATVNAEISGLMTQILLKDCLGPDWASAELQATLATGMESAIYQADLDWPDFWEVALATPRGRQLIDWCMAKSMAAQN